MDLLFTLYKIGYYPGYYEGDFHLDVNSYIDKWAEGGYGADRPVQE